MRPGISGENGQFTIIFQNIHCAEKNNTIVSNSTLSIDGLTINQMWKINSAIS